jgi:hypothetical protein
MSENEDKNDLETFSVIVGALKPLDRANQIRLLQTVYQFLGLEGFLTSGATHAGSGPASASGATKQGPFSTDRSTTVKQFVMEKQPKTDVERVACLAYYLTHFRDIAHFRTLEISKLNTEAAQPKFSNAHVAVDNATKMGYLAPATKGSKQISAAGEHFVSLLPDREAARSAMANMLRRKRAARKRPKSLAGGSNS